MGDNAPYILRVKPAYELKNPTPKGTTLRGNSRIPKRCWNTEYELHQEVKELRQEVRALEETVSHLKETIEQLNQEFRLFRAQHANFTLRRKKLRK